jgi:sugar lactone lactonase YvrE
MITTVAGNGEWGDGGDGGLATEAQIYRPKGVAVDVSENLYIATQSMNRIRKVDINGVITTVAGNGIAGDRGDGGPAAEAQLDSPVGVATDTQGNLYISDTWNQRVRKVDRNGMITTVAGNGLYGYSGDNGPAIQAKLNQPEGIFVDSSGNLYIADSSNYRIRKVDPSGIITTVAGSGERGDGGDGGSATEAKFWYPSDVTVDREGNLYIADWGNYVIRKVNRNGIITTVAGNRTKGYNGNDGPATQAQLDGPTSVAVDASGNLYIADSGNHRIRKVDKDGKITTIAGSYMDEMGYGDFWGDGGPAIKAALSFPSRIALSPSGEIYISDYWNDRIRLVTNRRGTITGLVTDSSTNQPLSDVMVAAKDSFRTLTAKTNSNGAYTVAGLAGGNFTATFTKSGYLKQTVTGTITGNETVTVNIQLTPIAPLTLTVTSPQDGATVNQSPTTVTGNVTNNANVTVNGIQALVSNNTFSASIPLVEGPNTITASATDPYGQTASQTINVTLLSKGSITGLVADASTGLPLTGATVSITDSLGNTKNALTDSNGRYTITDLLFGAFTGAITKVGYAEYRFSGTLSPGETKTINAALTSVPPTISNILVSNITKNSATITWTTDQPASSSVEYGTTASYGSSASDSILTTSHAIILTNLLPTTLYHFRVTSANEYGFFSTSVDHTFSTPTPPIILIITYPANGGTINRRDVMVKGIVINNTGSETGVAVNGMVAMVYGTEFVANHVPLTEGSNTIIATATDVVGNIETASITLMSVPGEHYIDITASSESGLSPLEITLTLESSLDLTTASFTYTGPAEIEFLSAIAGEYRIKIATEGIYYFTATIKDSTNIPYQDTIAIHVLSETELDALLRSKWEGMKWALSQGKIGDALKHITKASRDKYGEIFELLAPQLPTLVSAMRGISLVGITENVAEYYIKRFQRGTDISYFIYFVVDEDGIWRIDSF